MEVNITDKEFPFSEWVAKRVPDSQVSYFQVVLNKCIENPFLDSVSSRDILFRLNGNKKVAQVIILPD